METLWKKNKKGFTLIELLVVVAIGILAVGVVLIGYTVARQRTAKSNHATVLKYIAGEVKNPLG